MVGRCNESRWQAGTGSTVTGLLLCREEGQKLTIWVNGNKASSLFSWLQRVGVLEWLGCFMLMVVIWLEEGGIGDSWWVCEFGRFCVWFEIWVTVVWCGGVLMGGK